MSEQRLVTPPAGEMMERSGSLDSLDEPLADMLPAFSKENASAFTSPVSVMMHTCPKPRLEAPAAEEAPVELSIPEQFEQHIFAQLLSMAHAELAKDDSVRAPKRQKC